MKNLFTTAILTGVLSLTSVHLALAARNVTTTGPAPASVTRLNSRDLMIQGASDSATVQLHFAGAERLDLGTPGELFVTSRGSRKHYRPEAYQIINGKVRSLMISYTLVGNDLVTLNFGSFDPAAPIFVRGGASTL